MLFCSLRCYASEVPGCTWNSRSSIPEDFGIAHENARLWTSYIRDLYFSLLIFICFKYKFLDMDINFKHDF